MATVPVRESGWFGVPALAGAATAPPVCRVDSEPKPAKAGTPNDPSSRPTDVATTRKRSFTPLATVEFSQRPSRVASPSSRWNTQRRATLPLCWMGLTATPSPR